MRGAEEKQRMIAEELLDKEDHAQVENLKKTLKAQRQRRKKPLEDNAGDAADGGEDIRNVTRGQRSLPPLNASMTKSISAESSMRERLREKLKAGRSKAESILQQESPVLSPRTFTRSKPADTVTKFDEEQEVSALQKARDVEAQLQSKVRFRDAIKTIQKSHVPDGATTTDESYNFFTFNFDPDPETDEGKDQKKKVEAPKDDAGESSSKVEEEEAEEGEEGMGEDKSLVPEDDLFLIEQTARDFIEITAAEYEGYHNRLQKEKDLLFIPSLRQVPLSQKLPDNMQPRYLEDEGLYVGVRPEVSRTNQNILENRILQQDAGKKWFGDDGNILALPDPIKTSTTRPPIFTLHEGLEPALETLYLKAIQSKKSSQYMVGSGGLLGEFQLDIDISGIVFTHHPLFSREHVLANKLSQLYDQFLGRKQKNLAKLLTDKLHALRNAVQDISAGGTHGSSTITEQSIHEYKLDIRQTRKFRDAEQEKDRTLLKSLIKVWKEIKSLREFQKFNNTPVKLYLRKEEVNRKADEEAYEAEIQAEVSELLEEYMEEYEKNLKQYRTDLKQWKSWKKTQKRKGKKEGMEQNDEAEVDYMVEEPAKPSLPTQIDRHDVEVQVRDKAANIRRRPGEPILNPELSLSGYVTPDNTCPRGEVVRREDILKHSLFIKILFNNKEVSRTVTVRLGHDFRVHMGQIFNLQIFNWPESIKLQVHMAAKTAYRLLGFKQESSN